MTNIGLSMSELVTALIDIHMLHVLLPSTTVGTTGMAVMASAVGAHIAAQRNTYMCCCVRCAHTTTHARAARSPTRSGARTAPLCAAQRGAYVVYI